jgi:hypothetical protein
MATDVSQNAAATQLEVRHDSPTLAFAMQVPPEQVVSATQLLGERLLSHCPPAWVLPTMTAPHWALTTGRSVSAVSHDL